MDIEPFGAGRRLPADRAEIEPPHERPIQDHTGYDRRGKYKTHRAEKQFAGQAREHVLVNPQHDVHDVLMRRLLAERIRRPRIERQAMKVARRRDGGRRNHDRHQRLGLPQVELQDVLPGKARLGRRDHAVERETRRPLRHGGSCDLVLEQALDLVVKNQRKACHA